MDDHETQRAKARARYHKRLEHYRAYGRRKYQENAVARCAASGARSKTPRGKLVTYRSVAKQYGHVWELPDALALDLMTDSCFYCGAVPSPVNGIDRVDNARGYEVNNVVTACRMCNVAKNKYSREAFETWVQRAAAHQSPWRMTNV